VIGDESTGGSPPPPRPTPAHTPSSGSGERRRQAGLKRALIVSFTVLGHLALFRLMLWAQPADHPLVEPPAIAVALVDLPRPLPPPPPAPPARPAEAPGGKPKTATVSKAKPTPAHASFARLTPAPPLPTSPPASPRPSPEPFLELGEAQAREASGVSDGEGAGSGSGTGNGPGGECNMLRRLQTALARDGRVKSAVGGATGARGSTGRGMVVWNGDWVTHAGEEGKGLAALRQAIIWEVGFAPKACREQAVRGYVLVNLGAGTRIALGAGAWRWSDLLGARR
jgi:hypothetical protein